MKNKLNLLTLSAFVCVVVFSLSPIPTKTNPDLDKKLSIDKPQLQNALQVLECQLLQAKGDPTGQAEQCLAKLQISPTSPADWNNQGWSRYRSGRYSEAIVDFSKAVQLDPAYRKGLINKVVTLGMLGKHEEALSSIDNFLETNENDFDGLINKCLVYEKWRRFDLAIKWCSKAVELFPRNPIPLNNRGWAYLQSASFINAVKDFESAIMLSVSYADALANLQDTLFQLGDVDFSVSVYERLIKATDHSDNIRIEFAEYLVKSKYRLDRATEIAESLVKKNKDLGSLMLLAKTWSARGDRPRVKGVVEQIRNSLGDKLFRELGHKSSKSNNSSDVFREKIFYDLNFQSDNDRIACYLETIQRDVSNKTFFEGSDAGLIVDNQGNIRPEILKLLREVIGNNPVSRYENPMGYAVLEPLVKEELEVAKRIGILNTKNKILIGTLDLPSLNERVVDVPKSFVCNGNKDMRTDYEEKILLVNWRLFDFSHYMSKILLSELPKKFNGRETSVDLEALNRDMPLYFQPETNSAFFLTISEFLMLAKGREILSAPSFDLNSETNVLLVTAIRDGIEAFLIGHELAHIFKGHQKTQASDNNSVAFSWQQELEADSLGYQLAAEIFKGRYAKFSDKELAGTLEKLSLSAPLLFLRELEVIEAVKNLNTGKLTPQLLSNLLTTMSSRIAQIQGWPNHISKMQSIPEQVGNHPPASLREAALDQEVLNQIYKERISIKSSALSDTLITKMSQAVYAHFLKTYKNFLDGSVLLILQEEVDDAAANSH